MLGKIEGKRRRVIQRMRWLDGITNTTDMSEQTQGNGAGQASLACCSLWSRKELGTTQQLKNNKIKYSSIKKQTSAQ